MTPTEELRKRLDELGIKHRNYGYKNHVWWEGKDGVDWHAENRPSVKDPYVIVDAVITPKQAIAATVGVEMCRRVFIKDWLWECSECHSRHDSGHLYNFCPNCGRRIEVNDE